MYTIQKMYDRLVVRYVVVNSKTSMIQSSWNDYFSAMSVIRDLNRFS